MADFYGIPNEVIKKAFDISVKELENTLTESMIETLEMGQSALQIGGTPLTAKKIELKKLVEEEK